MPTPLGRHIGGALQRGAQGGYLTHPERGDEPLREFVRGFTTVVRRPHGARRFPYETGGAALVAERRTPAADLDGAAVGQPPHRHRTGTGHETDALVQPRGGNEEFCVSHHHDGYVEDLSQRGGDAGALAGVSQACPPTASAAGRVSTGRASWASAVSQRAAAAGSCGRQPLLGRT